MTRWLKSGIKCTPPLHWQVQSHDWALKGRLWGPDSQRMLSLLLVTAIFIPQNQTSRYHCGAESLGTSHFWKRVEKESNQAQDQAGSGRVRWRRRPDGQIPRKCTNVTAVLMGNPTDRLSLAFNRQRGWHLMIPKPSSRKADDTSFPPLYLGL